MDEKSLVTLEYFKVLERLSTYADFSASADLARRLRPTSDLTEALDRLVTTTEAAQLLSVKSEVSVGGALDVRPLIERARRSAVLTPQELLDVKATLAAARDLYRTFEHKEMEYPHLAGIAEKLPPPPGLIETISRTISDRAEILDSASPKLAAIRAEIKIAHERLMTKLNHLLNDPKNAPHLQENIITQRNGRYVIPVRAESRGRIRSIVHDQSASGATIFVEPLATVELNNQWHEAQLAERDEERRILAELTDQVGAFAGVITELVEALARMDLALMCAKYAETIHAVEPVLVPFRNVKGEKHPGSTISLYHARHPLLDPEMVVPLDIILDEKTYSLVITGPNTGGKTVTLKTVGLLVLMAQSGLHIPAQSGSTLSLFDNVYADIGDEQSIEQSLSTFSGHITNIVRILKRADSHCLVLFDELGAGTDPQEGSALARGLLEHLIERRITSLVATHYPELKVFAHATPGVVNASMEFDLRTLKPTYNLVIGIPGRSNALAIAERLGLSNEIIQSARGMLDPTDLQAEDLLDEIHHQRTIARKARGAADRSKFEADQLRKDLAKRLEKIEDERQAILEKARAEQAEEIEDLHNEVESLRKALARARQPLEALKSVQERVEELRTEVEKPAERRVVQSEAPRKLKLGDKVRLRTLNMDGVVAAIGEEEIEVVLGNLRVRARVSDVVRAGQVEAELEKGSVIGRKAAVPARDPSPAPFSPSPGAELDLRGQRAEDSVEALEHYLESAYLAGMPYVRIIHGKGTGRLRQVVREELARSEFVTHYESGGESEGGDGVTVAHIAKE